MASQKQCGNLHTQANRGWEIAAPLNFSEAANGFTTNNMATCQNRNI